MHDASGRDPTMEKASPHSHSRHVDYISQYLQKRHVFSQSTLLNYNHPLEAHAN
jgi:hypothetical protein